MQLQMVKTQAAVLLHALAWAAVCLASDGGKDAPFIDAFNGKDLSGWVVEGTKQAKRGADSTPVWSVRDGMIRCTGAGFGFLRFDRAVSDFILKLEFRLERGVNSGVGIRHGQFTGTIESRPSFFGYEIQLLDDSDKQPSKTSTGALYRYVAAQNRAVKPAGQWNQLVVECRGPHILVQLNGVLLHDLDQRSIPEIADKPLRGCFSLQNHGGDVDFRNIRFREL